MKITKKVRNQINYLVRKDEDSNRERILKGFKGNPKRFYGYMKNMQTVKENVTQLAKPSG